MIPIENKTDWNAIRAEYIGGASYGDLAKKYHLSKSTIYQHAKLDNWQTLRTNAANAARTKTIQKAADAAASNATIAADITRRLLLRVSRLEQKFPMDATQIEITEKGKKVTFRLKDLTASFNDVMERMPNVESDRNAPIYELLKKLDGECDV